MERAAETAFRAALTKMSQEMADQGLLIEAGFLSLRALAISPDAPPIQVEEMRAAFFAGAQHLFGSMMDILDPDQEPTANDMRRMELISKELDRFIEAFRPGRP